jgi:hypothetical protein
VLEKQGGRHSGIAGVYVNSCPVLGRVQKDFSKPAILEPASAGRISDAAVLKIE